MLLSNFLLNTVLILPFVVCDESSTTCIDGIFTALSEFVFEGGTPDDYYGNLCTNTLSVHSVWAASKLYCTQDEIDAGEALYAGYCSEYGLVQLVPYSEVLPDLTKEYIASLPVVEFADIDETKIWNTSVLISSSLFNAGERTTAVFEQQYNLHHIYGWAVYGFWGSILLIGIIQRVITHFVLSRRGKAISDTEDATAMTRATTKASGPAGVLKAAHQWVKTNLIIPSTFGSHHQRLLWGCTIPTRMETLVVVLYWILSLVLGCVSYEFFWPNLYYTTTDQKWRYISDRTGIMSYANLAVIWMFSGRNNIFLWLTGWNFGTFNIFHRHVARIATVQAIVHSVGYTVLYIHGGYFAEEWKESWFYLGAVATIAMSFLLLFSSILLRVRYYEVFLLLHIAFSILTIIGLFYHTSIFEGEYDPYLWPLFAIWGFDRFARFIRMLYCNLYVSFSGRPMGTTSTQVSYNVSADLIRLEVTPGSRILKVAPGQHYYLYQPTKLRGWENHPFTLAAWNVPDKPSENLNEVHQPLESSSKDFGDKIPAITTDSPSDESSILPSTLPLSKRRPSASCYNLTFFIRPYSSWTKRLRNECMKSPTGSFKAKMLIEGPYAERSPLHTFETVIFIVGGTGISGALPYLQEHLIRTSPSAEGQSKKLVTRISNIYLVWATKQSAMIHDIATRELAPMLQRADFHAEFHVTAREEIPTPPSDREGSPKVAGGSTEGIKFAHGRPKVIETIVSAVNEAQPTGIANGKVAILTCGPAGMADEARAAVHQLLREGKRSVDYFEETFGW